MKVTPLVIKDVLLIEPEVFSDSRGFFYESFNQRTFAESAGITEDFVQDNHSRSEKHVLRGIHYQLRRPQGKLLRVVAGVIFDVAVDMRRGSSTCGRWVGCLLNAEDKTQLWIPPGFAHGFLVVSDYAEVLYKATDFWSAQDERCIAWNDPTLAITWPTRSQPTLSRKDEHGGSFKEAEFCVIPENPADSQSNRVSPEPTNGSRP